jgi:hypothetical protein
LILSAGKPRSVMTLLRISLNDTRTHSSICNMRNESNFSFDMQGIRPETDWVFYRSHQDATSRFEIELISSRPSTRYINFPRNRQAVVSLVSGQW